jgi:hypothetical protein
MKRIAIYAGVVLVLLIGGAMFTIDSIARAAIESGVEAGLGVPAEVGSVRLRVLLGSFSMADLEIANADGYEADHFLRLGTVETEISYAALREGDVELKRLLLADLDLELEWKGRKANYDAILEGMGGSAEPVQDKSGGEGGSEVRFIIDELLIQNVVAKLHLDRLGEAEVKVPEIRLEGVGRKSGGVTMSEVTRRVMNAVLTAVMRKGKGLGPEFSGKLGSGLQEVRGLSSGSTSEKIGKASEMFRGFLKKDGD